MKGFSLSLLVALFFVVSCKKDDTVTPTQDFGYNYFPDHLGRFVVYTVDSTVYADASEDTAFYKFEIKEKIDSFFTDNQGRPAFRMTRYKKMLQNDTLLIANPQWVVQDVWWGNKSSTRLELVEENERYIKLTFPVEEGKVWNGNAYNTQGELDYEYTAVDIPLSQSPLQFDSTLTVLQYSSGTIPLYFKKFQEKYARGVGMVYKEITDYTWEQSGGVIIYGKIAHGLSYKMKAIQYGTE